MRIIKDARNPNRQVREAGRTVLESKQNKIIDADADQQYRIALKIAELRAEREQSPVIVAREVRA